MMKSTSLCFNIVSEWKLVIKNEMSYPYHGVTKPSNTVISLDPSFPAHRHPFWGILNTRQPGLTGIAFLLKMTNPSARMVMNLVNFLHKILSISSACLIQMDSRIELMDGSMRTRSDSLREMRRGWRRVSCELL